MERKRETATALFREGYNCAQSVFAAYAEDYGFTREQALRLSASFGAGIGRMRETCGAFSGAAMVLGLETGTVIGSDAAGKQRNYDAVQQLAARFREKHGTLSCRELLELSPMASVSDTRPADRTAAYYKSRPCPALVGSVCDLLDDLLAGL